MDSNGPSFDFLSRIRIPRGLAFGVIILTALLAFEIFNYSTTDYALRDLLGDLSFIGLPWATILAIAFCGIDFAGIARLFTPEQGRDEPAEVWYLFGAWILAAAMNATLTWWGVAVAIQGHSALGTAILGRETLFKVVPVFVAVMVWIIRILLIGTFSIAGERLFSMADDRLARAPISHLANAGNRPVSNSVNNPSSAYRPSPKPVAQNQNPVRSPYPEPTYHPVGMNAKARDEDQPSTWR